MVAQRVRRSWLDQFTLRQDVDNPFVQVITSAGIIATVACDRGGLSRSQYDAAVEAERQARLVEDLGRWLDDDVTAHARRCDEAISDRDLDPETRARALAGGLTGAVRAHATLLDSCQTLLGLADALLMISRPASRLRLMSAVETVRTAASTAHLTVLVNLPRITDVTLYDRLVTRVESFDTTLAEATRVAAALRSEVAVRQLFPSPRVPGN
ncbi:MAG: cyclodeaminase/cyclohydrolase family protein [Actinomycetes bacterium]